MELAKIISAFLAFASIAHGVQATTQRLEPTYVATAPEIVSSPLETSYFEQNAADLSKFQETSSYSGSQALARSEGADSSFTATKTVSEGFAGGQSGPTVAYSDALAATGVTDLSQLIAEDDTSESVSIEDDAIILNENTETVRPGIKKRVSYYLTKKNAGPVDTSTITSTSTSSSGAVAGQSGPGIGEGNDYTYSESASAAIAQGGFAPIGKRGPGSTGTTITRSDSVSRAVAGQTRPDGKGGYAVTESSSGAVAQTGPAPIAGSHPGSTGSTITRSDSASRAVAGQTRPDGKGGYAVTESSSRAIAQTGTTPVAGSHPGSTGSTITRSDSASRAVAGQTRPDGKGGYAVTESTSGAIAQTGPTSIARSHPGSTGSTITRSDSVSRAVAGQTRPDGKGGYAVTESSSGAIAQTGLAPIAGSHPGSTGSTITRSDSASRAVAGQTRPDGKGGYAVTESTSGAIAQTGPTSIAGSHPGSTGSTITRSDSVSRAVAGQTRPDGKGGYAVTESSSGAIAQTGLAPIAGSHPGSTGSTITRSDSASRAVAGQTRPDGKGGYAATESTSGAIAQTGPTPIAGSRPGSTGSTITSTSSTSGAVAGQTRPDGKGGYAVTESSSGAIAQTGSKPGNGGTTTSSTAASGRVTDQSRHGVVSTVSESSATASTVTDDKIVGPRRPYYYDFDRFYGGYSYGHPGYGGPIRPGYDGPFRPGYDGPGYDGLGYAGPGYDGPFRRPGYDGPFRSGYDGPMRPGYYGPRGRYDYTLVDANRDLRRAVETDVSFRTVVVNDGPNSRCYCTCDANKKPNFVNVRQLKPIF